MSQRTHASLLNRVARKLSRLRDQARDGAKTLQQEASHPGEPVPHRRSRSALHRSADDREADAQTPTATYEPGGDRSLDPLARPQQPTTAGADAWYLQGESEGWNNTNPTAEDDDVT